MSMAIEGDAKSCHVLGMRIDVLTPKACVHAITSLASIGMPATVCVANVHMVMEGWHSSSFRKLVNEATLVVPDGMPLVWAQRALGHREAVRVRGPDLVPALARRAARKGIPIGLFGGSPLALERLRARLGDLAPGLDVVYAASPPYRLLESHEEDSFLADIRSSGARIVFVGLGCPKQERWMARVRDSVDCVLIGVGAAFDFHAGLKSQAPKWMQRAGVEWLHRLVSEPRRLGPRYLKTNPNFIFLFGRQLIRHYVSLIRERGRL